MNRKIAPKIYNALDFNLKIKPCAHFRLSNNLPVYTLHAGKEEVVSVDFVFFAGNSFEEKNIVAASTNFLLKNGTAQKSAFEINEHFDYYGSFLNRSCYNETAALTLHALTKHLPELLPAMAEILTDATFPQEELDIYRTNAKQKLEVNLTKGDFVANRLIDEYVYGFDHPYGRYTSKEAFDAIEREELADFYKKYYTHGNCMLFVSGYLPDGLETLLDQHFGKLPFNIRPYAPASFNYTTQPCPQKKHTVINDENAVQGAIRIARPFPDRHSENYPKALVMNTIFGGYFGSRLMANIREEKGYTYGIHSYVQNHIKDTALMISTEAGRNVCDATIAEIWKEAKKMRQEPVDEEELMLVKNYLIGSILADIDGPFQIMNHWKTYVLQGLDENYFYKSTNDIKNVTSEEIQYFAQKYLQEEDFWQLVVY